MSPDEIKDKITEELNDKLDRAVRSIVDQMVDDAVAKVRAEPEVIAEAQREQIASLRYDADQADRLYRVMEHIAKTAGVSEGDIAWAMGIGGPDMLQPRTVLSDGKPVAWAFRDLGLI